MIAFLFKAHFFFYILLKYNGLKILISGGV